MPWSSNAEPTMGCGRMESMSMVGEGNYYLLLLTLLSSSFVSSLSTCHMNSKWCRGWKNIVMSKGCEKTEPNKQPRPLI